MNILTVAAQRPSNNLQRSPNVRTTPGKEKLTRTIQENLQFITEGGHLNPESPTKWKEAVEAGKTFLSLPGTQGVNPLGKDKVTEGSGVVFTSFGEKDKVSFVTMHQRWFTRVFPHKRTCNFVQWSDGETPKLLERRGDDDFPIHHVKRGDEDSIVTLGVLAGRWPSDKIITVYDQKENHWDGVENAISMPDLSERGVTKHPAGGYRFSQSNWVVNFSSDTDLLQVELTEKHRDEEGRLIVPEEPTALLSWQDGGLVWRELEPRFASEYVASR